MTVQIYYKIVFSDPIIYEEMELLKEYSGIFGIRFISHDKKSTVSFMIDDEASRDIKNKLSDVAAWTGKVGLDHCIMTISRIEDYHTNYENEELSLVLMQGISGSC